MLLKETFNRGPKLFPDKVAIVDGERRFTYRECCKRQNRLANALIDLGLRKDDCLGVLLKNCAEFFDAYGAGAKTGIVVAPINFRLNSSALKVVLEDIGCRVLLVDREFVDIINKLRPEMTLLKTYISVGCEAEGMLEYESLLKKYPSVEPDVTTHEDEPATIIYTSGTTGIPKGALATRKITVNRLIVTAIEMGITPNDRYICSLPLFHIGGNMVALSYVFCGATNVIQRDWEPKEFCRLVQDERVTKAILTPVIVNFIVNWPDASNYDLSSFKLLQYGGSPMPYDTLKKAMKLLPECQFQQGYGSSECYITITLKPEVHASALGGEEASVQRMASCGRSSILAMARVVKEDGSDVKPGEVGEIILGGSTVMAGYLNKPKETAITLKDGWCHTNDLATVDEEGYIYIVDRKNHMIITGGENVYPAQVENVLYDHPKIVEAVVIGVPDDTWGEAVKAIVVVKQGETLTQDEVIDFCRPRMANYAKPKSVDFVDSLPYTATGKINKLAIKEKYWNSSKN